MYRLPWKFTISPLSYTVSVAQFPKKVLPLVITTHLGCGSGGVDPSKVAFKSALNNAFDVCAIKQT